MLEAQARLLGRAVRRFQDDLKAFHQDLAQGLKGQGRMWGVQPVFQAVRGQGGNRDPVHGAYQWFSTSSANPIRSRTSSLEPSSRMT